MSKDVNMRFMETMRRSFVLRIAVVGVVAGALLWYAYGQYMEAQYANLYLQNTNYIIQVGMYENFKPDQFDVVMLGNSLTCYANWNEFLGRKNIANRGIPSDITSGYLHRLKYVYRHHPKLCFIEGGVNDVYANYTPKDIFRNITMIVDTLRAHQIVPVLQSTLFVARQRERSEEKNREIQQLNDLVSAYAKQQGLEYLEVNALVSRGGYLRDELTYDGIHLNADGYALWVPEVEKILVTYRL